MTVSTHRTVNPHAHWGDTALYPRGLPLEDVKHPGTRHYGVKYEKGARARVPIQQGLVQGDPDVDAVQRLTKRVRGSAFPQGDRGLVVGRGSMAPFNSQNTVFHYSAFWGLLLPSTTT